MLSGEGLIAVVNPRKGVVPPHLRKYLFKKGHGRKGRAKVRHAGGGHHKKKKHGSRAVITVATNTRRRARRNPRFSLPTAAGATRVLMGAGVGAIGALGLDLALSFGAQYLPAQLVTPGWGRDLTRLAGGFLIGILSGLVVKRETAAAITAGAVTVVAYDITKKLANTYVLPPTRQLAGEYTGYYPYLTGLHRGGSSGGSMGMEGYLPRAGVPRGRSTVSAFVEPDTGGPMGADIEL